MRKLWILVCLTLVAGCGSGTYSIPKQEYQSRVQVLGVLPLVLDRNGNINYPEREALYAEVERSLAGKTEYLVDKLRKKKGYFDVRELSDSPLIAQSLLSGGCTHDENGRPTGYVFDVATVQDLTRRNVIDGVLIIVFAGKQINETRRSRTKLESLTTRFDNVVATATVIDRQGQVLWQMVGAEAFTAVVLQYPDFDEAYYNRTDRVKIKDITMNGVAAVLAEDPDGDGVRVLPQMYTELFDRITSGISPGLFDNL